jgi:hypothetical protein
MPYLADYVRGCLPINLDHSRPRLSLLVLGIWSRDNQSGTLLLLFYWLIHVSTLTDP